VSYGHICDCPKKHVNANPRDLLGRRSDACRNYSEDQARGGRCTSCKAGVCK